MADEEIVPPVEEAKAPEQPELPLAEEAAPDAEATPETAEAEPPAEQVVEEAAPDWKDRELGSKHRQIQKLKDELARERSEKEALKALTDRVAGSETPTQPLQQTISQSDIDAAADRKIAHDRYVEDCNKTAETGEKAYGTEWRGAVQNLELLGGFDPDTMTGLLATDDPAKVLFELGKNPDNYHRIMQLPSAKRIIEMGKLAMTPVATKKVSEAPAPVNPVGGRAAPAPTTLNDNMSDDEWYAAAKAARARRFAARR